MLKKNINLRDKTLKREKDTGFTKNKHIKTKIDWYQPVAFTFNPYLRCEFVFLQHIFFNAFLEVNHKDMAQSEEERKNYGVFIGRNMQPTDAKYSGLYGTLLRLTQPSAKKLFLKEKNRKDKVQNITIIILFLGNTFQQIRQFCVFIY